MTSKQQATALCAVAMLPPQINNNLINTIMTYTRFLQFYNVINLIPKAIDVFGTQCWMFRSKDQHPIIIEELSSNMMLSSKVCESQTSNLIYLVDGVATPAHEVVYDGRKVELANKFDLFIGDESDFIGL